MPFYNLFLHWFYEIMELVNCVVWILKVNSLFFNDILFQKD